MINKKTIWFKMNNIFVLFFLFLQRVSLFVVLIVMISDSMFFERTTTKTTFAAVANCLPNCICRSHPNIMSECWLSSCLDSVDLAAAMLSVHGTLCHDHRNELRESRQKLTLFDDYCFGIENCRYGKTKPRFLCVIFIILDLFFCWCFKTDRFWMNNRNSIKDRLKEEE